MYASKSSLGTPNVFAESARLARVSLGLRVGVRSTVHVLQPNWVLGHAAGLVGLVRLHFLAQVRAVSPPCLRRGSLGVQDEFAIRRVHVHHRVAV